MVYQIEPDLTWGPAVGKSNVPKLFCGVEECKPWTKSEELPGRSYQTSYKISHPPLHVKFEHVETKPLKLAEGTMLRDFRFRQIHFNTTYGSAYKYKFNSKGLTDTPNTPHAVAFNLNYQWLDKVKTFPPCKRDPGISEMKYHYKTPMYPSEGTGILNDLRPSVICPIINPGKEVLEKTDSNVNCIQKVNDPYISTGHYDYVYHDTHQIRKYKHVKPIPIQVFEKKAVYDESFLGKKILDRFVRKKTPVVPHRGMLTEAQESFKYPLDELAHKRLHICSTVKCKPLTKGEVMGIPGMYHTEYEHIGHDWPLSSVV